jgi:hypothetical protein
MKIIDEGSVRIQRWKAHLKGKDIERSDSDPDQLEEIRTLRKFTTPQQVSKIGKLETPSQFT